MFTEATPTKASHVMLHEWRTQPCPDLRHSGKLNNLDHSASSPLGKEQLSSRLYNLQPLFHRTFSKTVPRSHPRLVYHKPVNAGCKTAMRECVDINFALSNYEI